MNVFINYCKKLNLYREISLLLFTLVPIICWCFKEFTNLGTDFGGYYAGAYFLSDEYSLYNDHFEHKGPVFYFFIKTIGNLIGWGLPQSLITLFLSVMVFYIPLIFIINKYCKTFFAKITMILLSVSLLYGQNSNSSIAFFQEGLLILSMLPVLSNKYKLKDFIIAKIFFTLAILTRIDSLIFYPVILIHTIRVSKSGSGTKKVFILLLFLFIPLLFFLFFSIVFKFNLNNFLEANFYFNSWYKENYLQNSENIFISIFQYFKRPTALLLSNQSLIAPFAGALSFFLISKFRKPFLFDRNSNLYLKNIIHHLNIIIYKQNISWLIGTLSLVGFMMTNSDRDYHSLIFICPFCFLIVKNINRFLKNPSALYYSFPIYLFYLYAFICGRGLYSLYKSQSYTLPYAKTIEYIRNNNISPEIIGGRGWPYLLVNKKPIRAINDWWLYKLNEPYITKNLKEQHEKLLRRGKGYIFWIDNNLLESNTKNILLKEIKSRSVKIEDQGYFSMYKIK